MEGPRRKARPLLVTRSKMSTRSKVVEFDGKKYEIRRLAPDIGSFIFMRMMGLSLRSRAAERELAEDLPKNDPAEPSVPISGEMQVRALAFSVFSGAIGFDDFKFIQNACVRAVSKLRVDTGMYMPVMADNGMWTKDGEDLENSVGAVMHLTTEVLILCFADFFEKPSLGI